MPDVVMDPIIDWEECAIDGPMVVCYINLLGHFALLVRKRCNIRIAICWSAMSYGYAAVKLEIYKKLASLLAARWA